MEKVIVKIDSLNSRGEGVGRVLSGYEKGFVVFVEGTIPGDVAECIVVEKKKNFMRGKPLRFLEQGEGRVAPACPHASDCGGCSWQHIDYKVQISWKENILKEALSRIAGINDVPIKGCIPSPRILGYRNKVEVPVKMEKGQVVAGFYRPYSHELVPSENCLLEHPMSREVIKALLDQVKKRKFTIYDEVKGRGAVRHLVSRVAPGTGERMAVIVSAIPNLAGAKEMADEIISSLKGLKSVVLNINPEKTNVILGQREKVLAGRPYIIDVFGDDELGRLSFRISSRSFYQVNTDQAVNLYRIALSAAEIRPNDLVYDVYCGIGTITLFAAKRAGFVVGIEEVREAVLDARRNARENGISNVEFREDKAMRVVPGLSMDKGRPDVVILDPPRGGAEKETLFALSRANPRSIIYISCNPATLARDLLVLKNEGWYPSWVQPVDMFPMTPHVESVVLMQNVKNK